MQFHVYNNVLVSSLMRGTWIEITSIMASKVALMSSLMRGTWIEIKSLIKVSDMPPSRPSCEGRGLKSGLTLDTSSKDMSSLMRGTWIEIGRKQIETDCTAVVPHARDVD